ncbi:hypothetical protein BCD96_001902 [Clostridium beijerinckii]|nr:hypothetical protein [Clostridium beijerinckii]NRT34579.1 hypothetical protein [Clostridium beijerinckii]NRT45990.1 hypothetical protein [Clostridium beijerinckii]NRT71191.1 hypothetical protein [Clostridium beijerinckii]NRU39712.1 hypothetical protein [Clostridium beijerinckii]
MSKVLKLIKYFLGFIALTGLIYTFIYYAVISKLTT